MEDGTTRIPMRDRLVILTRLGQGATGIVYKAFDLLDLRLVALKVRQAGQGEEEGGRGVVLTGRG